MNDVHRWTADQAVAWLNKNPAARKIIDNLSQDGQLENMKYLTHPLAGPIDLIAVAHRAGYQTALARPDYISRPL